MQEIVYQDVCTRAFDYLRQSGEGFSRESAVAALKLIEDLLTIESPDIMDKVILEIRRRQEFDNISVPMLCPPVNRSSIGYRDE